MDNTNNNPIIDNTNNLNDANAQADNVTENVQTENTQTDSMTENTQMESTEDKADDASVASENADAESKQVEETPVLTLTEEQNQNFTNRFGVNYADAISSDRAIFKGQKYRITVLSERLVRLEYSENGIFEDRPTELVKFRNFNVPKMFVTQDDKILNIRTNYFELTYLKEKPFLGSKFSPDEFLVVKLVDTEKFWYYGQAEARNFKANATSLDNAITMPELQKGLYSTDGFVSIDDSNTLIFAEDGSVGKRSDTRVDTYLFMYLKDFGYALKDYYTLTGYPPLVPRYALGVWFDRDETYDDNGIYDLINQFRKNEIPLSVLILDEWTKDGVTFNNDLISSPENLITNLNSRGVHLGVDIDMKDVIGQNKDGNAINVPFNVFSKEFMEGYLEKYIKPLNDAGIDLFKINYKGKDKYTLRMINYYMYKFLAYNKSKRGLILSRNGLVASHLYPVCDSGETLVSWRTLKMLPLFTSTSSNIGVSWWSHAIGGYKEGIEDSNLYIRFVQYGVYSPIFRLASKGGHYYKREPWRWDVETLKIVRDYTNIRQRLIPYLYSESYKYAKTGLPLIQPLYYVYPELYDEPTYRNEYYFGTELFIAPITDPKDPVMNRTVVKLFLPDGIWYDFKTGKKFPGGRQITFVKDEDYPVFAKQGAIIPLTKLKEDDDRNFTGNPETLTVHVFPGKDNTYQLFEDDGLNDTVDNNKFCNTAIDYNYLPNNYTVIIRHLDGDTSVIPKERGYKIKFRNTRRADAVLAYLDDTRIDVKSYVDDQDFVVEVPPFDPNRQLSINCKGKDIEIDAVRLINEDIDTIISDLKIKTNLKDEIAKIIYDDTTDIKDKRIAIRKLHRKGLGDNFVKMFLKLLEYIAEI